MVAFLSFFFSLSLSDTLFILVKRPVFPKRARELYRRRRILALTAILAMRLET